MGNAAAILNADKKRITHLDDELEPLDTVPPIIKETSVGHLTKRANSFGKSNEENELMSEQLLGFNINTLFESKARKNNIEPFVNQNEESKNQSESLVKSKKISKSTSDYILDHRANRKSYSIGGSSVEASKHTEKLSDIENFITESSKQNEKQISYQDYEKLFGLLLNSDENQVIDTIRKYKQQLNIPVDNPKDEPPMKEITESTSSVPQVKPESGRKKITHSKQITSRSEFGGKTDRSSSSANSKLAKQIPRRDKSAINDSKIPRMRKSVLSQPLISIKNKNKRRSSIVKSQNSAVESNSIIEKSDSSVYYSAVDTNIKSSKSRQKLRDEKQQDKLSLSVISSQASPKSFSDEESKHQRSLSPSSDESDDSQSEKLTKLNTPEEDEKQLFE